MSAGEGEDSPTAYVTAMTARNVATVTRRRRSVARMARPAPTRAPGITPTMRAAATRQSTWPSSECVIAPGTAKSPTHTSDVAIAAFTSMRTKCTNAGTMITPPPIPSSPDKPPATTPIAAHRPAESEPSGGLAGASGASVSASGSSDGTGGAARPIRYDDSSSSAAVSSWRRWPSPGTCSAARLPSTAKTRPGGTVAATAGSRMRPSRQ